MAAAAPDKTMPRVAVGQLNSTGDHAANLAQAEKLCEDAAAAGATVAEYRKIHLFDVDVPGGATLLESRSTAPGKAEAVVVDARDQLGFTFGLTTCYDVRFPELYVALARRGCDAILVPSA